MLVREIDRSVTPRLLLDTFGGSDGFCLLDSENSGHSEGRYSFACPRPAWCVVQTGRNRYVRRQGRRTTVHRGTVLEAVREQLSSQSAGVGPFPFCGGFAGYLTYDFGWLLDKFAAASGGRPALGMPLARLNYYDEVFVFDHREERAYFVSRRDGADKGPWLDRLRPRRYGTAHSLGPLRSSLCRSRYLDTIVRTKGYIARGDIYQANISQRFSCAFSGDARAFYASLRRISPAPFGAFIRDGGSAILCNSPERFLLTRGSRVETRPIKGTRKRADNIAADRRLVRELAASDKDRAEHVMIVDLERNDLGRVCVTGSVAVRRMMSIESFSNVHHMISVVAGRLRPGTGIADCIGATFPGGSITGAPKFRAMEIIDELEPVRRGIYCGSIGYIDDSGNADLNIAIRTGVIAGGRLHFYAGGGIVADSDPQAEFDETIVKARAFLAALGMGTVRDA